MHNLSTMCISVPSGDINEEARERHDDVHVCPLTDTTDTVALSEKDWCRHRDWKTQTVTAHKQRGVTNINSKTIKSSTWTSGRWLNVSNCFVANYLTRCSLAQSVYSSHTHSQRHLLHRFSLCLPVLPPFFAGVFHLFCPLASPFPLNHILLLSFHTVAHSLQHNGFWSGM